MAGRKTGEIFQSIEREKEILKRKFKKRQVERDGQFRVQQQSKQSPGEIEFQNWRGKMKRVIFGS